MHIMVVPSWYSSNENPVHGSFFKEQFKALQRSGEKVTVAYNEIWPITALGKKDDKSGISLYDEEGLVTYRYKGYNFLPKVSLMFSIFNKRMEKLYLKIVKERGEVDVIHAHSSFWGGISAAYVSKKYNIPLVITEHSSLKHAVYCKKSYIPYVKKSYDSASKIIAVSSGLKKELEEYTTTKIEVIHNMIDKTIFTGNLEANKSEKIKYLSCGYLVEGKGFPILIEAFEEAFRNEDVTLQIAGEGYQRGILEEKIKNLNLEGRVKLLGLVKREELSELMNECNIFVLPSEHETFGMVYIEALASGKPVIGAYNGGAEDIITEENGLLVPKNDKKALIKALKYMKNNFEKYNSETLRDYCLKKFGEEKIINEIKRVYESIR